MQKTIFSWIKSRLAYLYLILLIPALLMTGWAPPVQAAEPDFITYVVPPITDEVILPTSSIPSGYRSNSISVAASPGEYKPASFIIRALVDTPMECTRT